MKLALVSDIHGNHMALEAVVADGKAAGVDIWWALGDLVAIGPEPSATLEILADLPGFAALAGNTERYTTSSDRPPSYPDVEAIRRDPTLLSRADRLASSFSWTRGYLEATGWLEWIGALPPKLEMTLPDGSILVAVHSTPERDDGRGLSPDLSDEQIRNYLVASGGDILCAGHTHRPTRRAVAEGIVVNSGCVSNPITPDLRPSYAIITATEQDVEIEHRRVEYDRESFLGTLERSSHPTADDIARFNRGEMTFFHS